MEVPVDVAISIEHLNKDFKGKRVLKNVCHQFEAGKIHGIIGSEGSGKTVLLKCICGFMLPTSGRIMVDYEEVGKDLDFPDDMGIIIESPGFLPQYSGMRNLEILASLRKRVTSKQMADTMRSVGLDPMYKKRFSKYTPEMRQRLGIAQAIMENPSLLILDEPMNGMDKEGKGEMVELFTKLKSSNKTILMASNDAGDIAELCDTLCEMDAGVLTERYS